MKIDWLNQYMPYITSLNTFLNVMKHVKKWGKGAIFAYKDFMANNELEVGEIYQHLNDEHLKVGDNVYTQGMLCSYAQVFMPYTNVNSVWSPASEESTEDFNQKYKGTIHEIPKGELLFERKEFILPVKRITPFSNIGCAFLYDNRFSGFYSKNPQESNKYAKPILVLYDIDKHSRYLNHEIEIYGRLCVVPPEIAEKLNITYNDDIRDICSNFYRPYNMENNLICISLLEEKAKVRELRGSEIKICKEQIEIPIFVEANINGIMHAKDIQKTISNFLPNTYERYLGVSNLGLSLKEENSSAITFTSTDNINVVYKNGNIGFYMNTLMFDKQKFELDMEKYVRYINNFSIDYNNFCKKELGKKKPIEVSFMFDDSKKDLFIGRYVKDMFDNSDYDNINGIDWTRGKICNEM